MSYSVIFRNVRHVSSYSTKNFYLCNVSSALFKTHSFNERKLECKRNFSFQSSIESIIKTQTGIFRTISESTPVEYLQNFVVDVHDITGLPWWATVMCTTVLLRSSVTVPLAIYQNYILGKVHHIQSELSELAKELRNEVAIAVKLYNWDEKTAQYHFKRSLKKQWNSLVIRENCHPVKASLLIWFQIPMWICFSVALRNLVYILPKTDVNAQIIFNELSVEGFGWIVDLTQADPFFILPVAMGLINLAIVELQFLSKPNEPTKLQRYVLNFFRGFSIFMIPVTACVPSCVALYWTTSSMYGLAQNLILLSPKVKRFCHIPQTSSELEKPYTHIFNGIKRRVNSISNLRIL
ncbi:hypothetical protein ILUMI_07085 [Ignelater luminosus]|uniref:Membrane insertase YidC/Oxa/ALB C-terminal domain-containing protein n=1 Tax=Ignelater luminosus TaxID=2038154 RepID=A0A8K0D834_IGNLU|nr:hypothetical protein ILUMI_07085 [Ignelater luminosus]